MMEKDLGASADADRATLASPRAPTGLGHSESVPSAVRPPHGGYPNAAPGDVSARPILLEIQRAEDRHYTFERRWRFLQRWFRNETVTFADRDGSWTILDFLDYVGELSGWPWSAQAIEARSGETRQGLDPKGESAVPKGCAQ